jgi:hypothetical protein
MRMGNRKQRRALRRLGGARSFAICAALLWLLGVEALPNLHLAFHTGDHTHAADGTIIADRNEAELERLYLRAHAERGTKPRSLFTHHQHGKRKRSDQLAISAPAHGHAAAGIAHHATALHQPPPPLLAPVTRPVATTFVHAEPNERVSIAEASRPVARGPPRC